MYRYKPLYRYILYLFNKKIYFFAGIYIYKKRCFYDNSSIATFSWKEKTSLLRRKWKQK